MAFLILVGLVIIPILTPHIFNPKSKDVHKGGNYSSAVMDLLSFLASQDHTAIREILLANIWIGPAIMYHTSFDVVGTPNHNNDAGIIDTHRILTAEDDSDAKALIEVRGIDYILIDDRLKKFAQIKIDSASRSEDALTSDMFIDRLSGGEIPDWLI